MSFILSLSPSLTQEVFFIISFKEPRRWPKHILWAFVELNKIRHQHSFHSYVTFLIWFQVLESVKKGTKGQKVFNHKSIAVHQVKMCVIVWDSFAVLLNYQGVDTKSKSYASSE